MNSSKLKADTAVDKNSVKSWDKVGLAISFLCLIHCVALPFSFLLFPSVATFYSGDEDIAHLLLFAFLAPAALFAGYAGFRVHKVKKPLVLLAIGVFVISIGTFFAHNLLGHSWEAPIVIVGSLIMVRAHFLNTKHCKKCEEEKNCIWG